MSWLDRAAARAGVKIEQPQVEPAPAEEQDSAWKYLTAGDIAGLADYTNREYNYRDIPYIGQFFGHASDAATQGVADVAQFVGAEGVGNYLNEAAKSGEKRLPAMMKPELSLNYITNPNGLPSAFAQVVGSMLPIGAAAYTAPVGGLTAAAANVASKVPVVGGLLGASAPHAIRWGLTSPIEAGMEAGGSERDMREAGMSNEEARQKSWDVFVKNAALLAATNAVGGAALPHIFKGVTKAAQNGNRLAGVGRFAGATGTEVGINALEEGEQQGIQDSVMGKPYSYNPFNWSEAQKEAAEFGVAGTAPFALFGLPATVRNVWNGESQPSEDNAEAPVQAQPQAQPQSVRIGQGEGTTWKAQTDSVSFDGATDDTKSAIELLGQWFYEKTGKPLIITSVTDGTSHSTSGRGHKSGHKFDVNDWGSGAEGTLLGEDGGKGTLADEFIAYGKSLGLGMNWEGDHIDVSTLGDQWEGEDAGKNFGGLNASKSADVDMSRFNDKQREAWQEAQWVESQTGIPAEYVYRQWAHESGNFTSRLAQENNNFGGLTQSEPNGEENKQPDGGNYYRMYNNMHEYAQSYVNDFINKYEGKENIKSLEDFANFLHDNGYYTDDPANYIAGMRGVEAPSGGAVVGGSKQSTRKGQSKPTDTSDPEMDKMYEEFARYWRDTSRNVDDIDYFSGLFNSKDKFKDTEENREKIRERVEGDLKEDFQDYVKHQQEKVAPSVVQPKSAPAQQDIEARADNLDRAKQNVVRDNLAPVATGSKLEQVQSVSQPVQQAQENLLRELQKLNQQNGNTQSAIQEFDNMQKELESRAGISNTSPQIGGNINGNESTESKQAPAPEGENTANQNQNPEPGQGQEAEGQVSSAAQGEFVPSTYTASNGKEFPSVKKKGGLSKGDEKGELAGTAHKYHGVVDTMRQTIIFRNGDGRTAEENRDAFLSAVNGNQQGAPAINLSERTEKEAEAVKQFRKNAAETIQKYRAGKKSYEEALAELERMLYLAEKYARDETAKQEVRTEFVDAVQKLEEARQEKEGVSAQEGAGETQNTEREKPLHREIGKLRKPLSQFVQKNAQTETAEIGGEGKSAQKADYSSKTLEELKVERQRLIDDEVQRYKSNPGGQGVNYDKIKTKEGVDSYEAWNNDVPRGSKPLLIESSGREEPPKAKSRVGRLRDNGRSVGQTDESSTDEAQPDNITDTADRSKQGGLSNAEQEKSIFGDEDQNISEMFDALGISEDEAEEEVSFGNEFGDTTDEEIEALKKELQKELSKLSANPMFNPRIYTLGLQLGGKYIQKGYRTFKKWLNKMIEDLGEPIEPWAPAIWETLKTYPKGEKFDPKQVMAVSKVIGNQFEKGITTLEGNQDVMKKLLKGKYKSFAPMIEASYNGIKKFFDTREEGNTNVTDRAEGLASRAGEGDNQDRVGRNDESGRPSGRDVRKGGQKAGNDVQQQSGTGVRDSGTSGSGKAGNSGVQAEESEDRADSTRGTELSGSVRDSYEGSVALDDGRKAEDIVSPEERQEHERKEVKQKNVKYKAGNLESIKADLPMLLPEQQEDVQIIEKRLLVDDGAGFLLTNGTGTGKTYSGLGVIKRLYDSGKKNILIVVPSEEVAKQWAEAAGKDFGITVKPLSSTRDNGGNGVCVTTYANFQQNKELAMRDWDAVVADEAHNLMQNANGEETGYLKMLRSLTLHPQQFYNRWKLQNRTKKIRALEDKIDSYEKEITKLKKGFKDGKVKEGDYGRRVTALENNIKQAESAIVDEYSAMNDKWKEVEKQLKAIDPKDKPKVLFLSATPFAYDKDVFYAEGYLFDAPDYNRFMIEKFGYRIRYHKLTRPDAQVDNRVMEVAFHDYMVNSGTMHGRQIDLDVDYDRGFLLVDGGIGKKIDEGFKFLWDNKKYRDLGEVLRKQFNNKAKRYLLESIKAQAVIPLVQEYIKNGKKVVLFHQAMKEKLNVHPFQLKGTRGLEQEQYEKVKAQWEEFQKERPDLVALNLGDVPAPMTTFRTAFKDALYIDGSAEHKKGRDDAQKLFNDDNSGKNLIICQQDAANAGISLHDTTGKHQRVLINIATPERPIYAMQIEGRIYRVGSKTNAIFRYLTTGTEMEKGLFANTIGSRAETAENLAMGLDARGLHDSFTNLFMETMDGSWERRKPGHAEEGTGGKEMDFSGKEDVTDWQRAISFYYGQQKKTSSTKAQEGKDYFATPEPIGLKMVEWLGLKDGDSALEPSAGHGAISRWFSPNTSNTIVEPSSTLAPLAQMVTPGAKVVDTTFEDFNLVNKFDGIAMNPPFGSGGKTAVEHIAKAFRHLKDGGRMVAILPEGPSADAHFNKWLYGENKNGEQVQKPVKGAVLTANIHLPAVTFNRAGTGVATRIVVIDKHMNSASEKEASAKAVGSVDLRNISDINKLFERMENMTVPERIISPSNPFGKPAPVTAGESQTGSNFTTGYHEHTKTGEKIPQAKFKDRVDFDTYKAMNSKAKEYGGYYSKVSRSFLFKDEGKRDEFVRAADALMGASKNSSGNNLQAKKLSAQAKEIQRLINQMKAVADKDLTAQQKKIRDFAQRMGVKVRWMKGHPDLHGFYATDGSIVLNANSKMSLTKTFYHELFHWMADNNTQLYSDMFDYIQGLESFSKAQLDAYRKKVKRPDMTDERAIEEMLADEFEEVTKRAKFVKELANKNPGLAERFIAWVKRVINKFAKYFHNQNGGLTTAQRDSFVRAFGAVARDMVDDKGNKLFRVSADGKSILTRQGEPIETVGELSQENNRDNMTEAEYNVSKLRDTQRQELFERVNKKIDDHIKEQLRKGVSEEELYKELQSSHSAHREAVLNGYRGAVREVEKIRNSETERHDFVKHYGYDVDGKRDYEVREAYELLLAQMKGVVDYAGFLYQEIVIDRARAAANPGLGLQVGDWRSADLQRQQRLRAAREAREVNNDNAEHAGNDQGALSLEAKRTSYSPSEESTEQTFFRKAVDKLGKGWNVKSDKIALEERKASKGDIGAVFEYYLGSPSRIAEHVKAFRLFYRMGDRAMNLLTKNRSDFQRKLDAAFAMVKTKDEQEKLQEVLWSGDAEQKEYTQEEILAEGGTDNVAKAYKQIRRLMNKAYKLVNEARKRPTPHSRHLTVKEISDLEQNKFVDIQKIGEPREDGKRLVTYKEYANWEKTYDVSQDELQRLEEDEAIQILDMKENDDGSVHLKVREGIGDLTKNKGYIPHFFHEYMIRVVDKDGEPVEDYGYGGVLTSARSEKEAVEKAEEWLKKNPDKLKEGQNIRIAPKVFSFRSLGMDEAQYAAVMGDKDFDSMIRNIAKNNDMSLAEARDMVRGSAKKKNRHRFFGNTLKRNGAKGFEKNMQWVLRHYFNSASRYHALETEFKPQAISLFERLFGDYDKRHVGLAKYTQDFIRDINGNPSEIEEQFNKFLNNTYIWRKYIAATFGERAALRAANGITNMMSYLCLGCLNTSSALLNFSQVINAAAYMGDLKAAPMIVARGAKRKYGVRDMRVLMETNVANDIGLDSGSGYDKSRVYGTLSRLGNKGMVLFKTSEAIIRRGTVLAAYDKAIAEGKSHDDAINYAKEVNRKSNFDYSVVDAPNIFRRGSILSQIALQFKKYGIKEMEVVADMLPGSSKTSMKQKAIFWGMYFLACGMLQVPLFDWWDKLFGGKDKIQKAMMEAAGDSPLGKFLATTAMYGLAASTAGIDMSSRAGLADVVPSEGKDFVPPAINKPASFAQDMVSGDYSGALRDVSPGLYNQYAAWLAGQSEGKRGRTNTVYEDAYSKILRSMGFKSTEERVASDIQRITYNEKDKLAQEKQDAVDAYIEDPSNENAKRLRELGVKPSTVKKERERKKRDRLGRIKVDMSKEDMKRNKELFKFAE